MKQALEKWKLDLDDNYPNYNAANNNSSTRKTSGPETTGRPKTMDAIYQYTTRQEVIRSPRLKQV